MKLRNKKTGDVLDFDSITNLCFGSKIQLQATNMHNKPIYIYNSLAELNTEWEDYEEPKEFWYISDFGFIFKYEITERTVKSTIEEMKSIGNYFETKEEVEKAVEKLKAWKRLKDKGFHWLYYNSTPAGNSVDFHISDWDKEATRDLDLLFGGEK